MSLVPCSNCGAHHFSNEPCPHCPASYTPQRKNIGLLLGLGLAACDGGLKDSGSMAMEYGVAWVDQDGDGWDEYSDCDDQDPEVHPEAEEIPDDGVDSNCDGEDNT